MRISNELRKILEDNRENKIVEKLLSLCKTNRYINDINYLDIAIENPSKISYISKDRVKRFKTMGAIKLNDKVLLKETSGYWGQSDGTVGIVISVNDSSSYLNLIVKWGNGDSNSYNKCDLIALDKRGKIDVWEKQLRKSYAYMTSPGKLVKKLNIECNDKDIQEFGRLFYSDKLLSAIEGLEFRVFKGDDIVKYYNADYYTDDKGSLGSSCMKYDSCDDLIKLYAKNPDKVQMLVLYKPESDTISGRALVWNDVKMTSPEEKIITLLDRVYVNNDNHSALFVSYAKSKGWAYKERNSADYNKEIGIGEQFIRASLETSLSIVGCDRTPWMDTFAWGRVSGNELQLNNYNDGNEYRDTDGAEFYPTNTVYSEWHDEDIDEDDAVYSSYLSDNIRRDGSVEIQINGRWDWMPRDHDEIYRVDGNYYHSSSLVEDAYGNMQLPDNVTEVNGEYYPNDEVVYSEYLKEDILKDDAVYSEYHKSYLVKSDATEYQGDWYSEDVVDEIMNEKEELVEVE